MTQALREAIQSKYGLTVNDGIFVLCSRDIRAGRARKTNKASSRITHYLLVLKGQSVGFAYDTRDHIVTSILDPVPLA